MVTVESIAQKMRENYKNKPISLMAYTLGMICGMVEESEEGAEVKTIDRIKMVCDAYQIVETEFPVPSKKFLN